jgi:hypothetical protein
MRTRKRDPNELNRIVEESPMASADTGAWGHSSIPGGWWLPAGIALDETGTYLVWEDRLDRSQYVEPTPDLLREFLAIAETESWEQTGDAVLRFARKWGPLHLCAAHLRPVWHTLDLRNLPFGGSISSFCPPVRRDDGRLAEPVWGWRYIATRFRDTLHANALFGTGRSQPVSLQERRTVDMLLVKPERAALVTQVRIWLEDGAGCAVQPVWTSDDDLLGWRAEVHTLVAALALALGATLRGSPGLAVCANCLKLFPIHQRNQRYCSRSECKTEYKRVQQAKRRAGEPPPPEYSI